MPASKRRSRRRLPGPTPRRPKPEHNDNIYRRFLDAGRNRHRGRSSCAQPRTLQLPRENKPRKRPISIQWRIRRHSSLPNYASQVAKPGHHFKVFSDNQAGLHRLRTPSDNPGQACQFRTIEAAFHIANKGATVSLHWVPGHTEIPGNELADALAKEATKETPNSYETSYALLGYKIKQIGRSEWEALLRKPSPSPSSNPATYAKNYPWKLQPRIQLPQGTKRKLASALYQLKSATDTSSHTYTASDTHPRTNASAARQRLQSTSCSVAQSSKMQGRSSGTK
jgi:hypothetical protein